MYLDGTMVKIPSCDFYFHRCSKIEWIMANGALIKDTPKEFICGFNHKLGILVKETHTHKVIKAYYLNYPHYVFNGVCLILDVEYWSLKNRCPVVFGVQNSYLVYDEK